MRRRPLLPSTARAVALLLALGACLAAACEPASGGPLGRGRGALSEAGPALAPPDDWRRLSLGPTGAVTPCFDPEGERLVVRGLGGIGLFVFSLADGALTYAEEGYQGDAAFTPAGALCRGPRGAARALRLDEAEGRAEAAEARCTLLDEVEGLGERLHHGAAGAVYHDAYAGTVTRVSREGEVIEVTSDGAWSVVVSPDGRRTAWVRGTLSEPELTVRDVGSGALSLGRGAHPAWSPSGRFLLFTRPYVDDGPDGRPVYEADLFVLDAATGEVARLTDTPDVAEMQPAVAPDGRSVAFADWASGVVYVADAIGLAEEGGRR